MMGHDQHCQERFEVVEVQQPARPRGEKVDRKVALVVVDRNVIGRAAVRRRWDFVRRGRFAEPLLEPMPSADSKQQADADSQSVVGGPVREDRRDQRQHEHGHHRPEAGAGHGGSVDEWKCDATGGRSQG